MADFLPSIIRDDQRPYLSIATRNATHDGGELTLTTTNWEEVIEVHRAVSVSAKVERTLRLIGKGARIPGSSYTINVQTDYPLFSAVKPTELVAYLSDLQKKLLVDGPVNQPGGTGNYTPTIDGWQKIEPTLTPGGEPDRCFVAMWFINELDSVYEVGFARAIEQCGFHPYRVKEDPTNKSVIDRILAEIRRSHFVVADYTGLRPSVYYEAGFAHGIGREVISCCRAGETEKLAFDTRHLGHIVWTDAEDLQTKLVNSIQANIVPRR